MELTDHYGIHYVNILLEHFSLKPVGVLLRCLARLRLLKELSLSSATLVTLRRTRFLFYNRLLLFFIFLGLLFHFLLNGKDLGDIHVWTVDLRAQPGTDVSGQQ